MKPPITIDAYLIVRSDGSVRVTKTTKRLLLDEVAFPLKVTIPRTWGQVMPTRIEVELPEPPEARVIVGDPELAPEEIAS